MVVLLPLHILHTVILVFSLHIFVLTFSSAFVYTFDTVEWFSLGRILHTSHEFAVFLDSFIVCSRTNETICELSLYPTHKLVSNNSDVLYLNILVGLLLVFLFC